MTCTFERYVPMHAILLLENCGRNILEHPHPFHVGQWDGMNRHMVGTCRVHETHIGHGRRKCIIQGQNFWCHLIPANIALYSSLIITWSERFERVYPPAPCGAVNVFTPPPPHPPPKEELLGVCEPIQCVLFCCCSCMEIYFILDNEANLHCTMATNGHV